MAAVVEEVLSTRDPDNADVYRGNLATFVSSVDRLDAALRTATATLAPERRLLLTYHDAYAYFARDYGWTVVAAVQPSTFDEPSPRDVADLVEQIRALGVTAIFGSEVFPSPVLEQIAAESGATYVADLRDDDLPGEPGDAEHSWFELMRVNYVTIIDALGGDASTLQDLALGSGAGG
jgi:ABC-type Zn uptake system ZnuABC Zn-binding protein ZnuA